MARGSKLLDMLTGYAAAHRHPFNVAVHMIGIPTIMFGVFVILSKGTITINGFSANFAHLTLLALFVFYLTLDIVFSLAFLVFAVPVTMLATLVGTAPFPISGTVAAVAFFGGYAAQFIGHAVEKSAPVILKHPVQANLAAPFFTVVEFFHILGLRDELFNEVQRRVAELQREQAA